MEKEVEVKEKKHIKIAGITLWRIVAYFIIYSVAGFIIETIFGVLTKGVLEYTVLFAVYMDLEQF